MRQDYDIVGSYNNQHISSIDSERTVNMYEYIDSKGKRPKTLLFTSGIVNTNLNFSLTTGGFRGQFVFNDIMYVVIGGTIWRITVSLTYSQIGNINTDSGYVGINANTFQVIFVDGQDGWIWDTTTNTFTKITDTNFPIAPIDVSYLDGFFIIAAGTTNTFVLSQFDQGLIYTPLQQGAITSHPGTIVACKTLHRRLFLFSQFFTEVWENAGEGTNLPFRRNNTLLMEIGTPAIGSVIVGFDRMFFLSQDRGGLNSVMEVRGSEAIPISNRALDVQLSQYARDPLIGVIDARAILIKENGIIFYRLNFTKANHTFVFNLSMSTEEDLKWHEEEILNGDRHPAQTQGFLAGNNYYGHYTMPILYRVDPDITSNDGEAIRRMRIGKPFSTTGYPRIRIDRFLLDLLQGNDFVEKLDVIQILAEDGIHIIVSEDGTTIIISETETIIPSSIHPIVFLSISKDGGQTYGNEITAPMGAIGERTFRTVWRKLGTTKRGQSFVPKFQFFSEIKFVILGAAWDIEVLPE